MNEKRARRIVRERADGRCEIGHELGTDMHHRKNRSQGGQWSPENLMLLCHEHHMRITVNPTLARSQGWSVPSWDDPTTTLVWIFGREFVLLTPSGDYITSEDTAA